MKVNNVGIILIQLILVKVLMINNFNFGFVNKFVNKLIFELL